MDDRNFIKIDEEMPDHPKIEGLSDKAFRLLITTWCWCKRKRNDGLIRVDAWQRRGPGKARAELEAEMVHAEGHQCPQCPPVRPGYVLMHDFTQHQTPVAEIERKQEAKRQAGVAANHARWHEKRGVVDPSCPLCDSDSDPSRIDDGEQSESDRNPIHSLETEIEIKRSTPDPTNTHVTNAREKPGVPPEFEAFWVNYPRKEAKAAALKAWPRATRKLEADRLVKAAAYWAGLWRDTGTPKEFIPYPATWLNGERWNDEPPARRNSPNGYRPSTTDARMAAIQALKQPEQPALPGAIS